MSHYNLDGKVVFITGASSGIGKAAARYLAQCGAKVALAARRKERLEDLADSITEAGGEAAVLALDVTDAEAFKTAVKRAAAHFGRLDALVNNAGCAAFSALTHADIAAWQNMVNVNINGVLNGIAAALPLFEAQQSGHIINVASVAGTRVLAPGGVVYSATKFAVRAISEGLRQEAGPYVHVTSLCPGSTQSEIFPAGADDPEVAAMLEWLKRTAIPAEEMAEAIAYALARPAGVNVSEIIVRPVNEKR